MRKRLLSAIILTAFICISSYTKTSPYSHKKQSRTIKSILKKEKSTWHLKNLITILNRVDNIYGNLYNNLNDNKKLVVFIDPAHGKNRKGVWTGGRLTNRESCTNRPEEFYSIKLSRALYSLLSRNRFIEIRTTDDFMQVLKGKSESYLNIPFPETVRLAKKAGAFIILSEHLNNVAVFNKADGRINLPGLHVTYTKYSRRKMLKLVPRTYKGFLTLYNKLDSSGFSYSYALNLKRRLKKIGMKPNHWEKGAVGDDRFSYFVDFPVSIIYESAFVSNPHEEKMLRNPEHIQNIVTAQYKSLLETVDDITGVDISGDKPVKTKKSIFNRLELLKLSRIAVYYLKNAKTKKAVAAIKSLERKYGKTRYSHYLRYYTNIRKRLARAEKNYSLGKKYKRYAKKKMRRREYRRARRLRVLSKRHFKRARRLLAGKPVFIAYRIKYSKELYRKRFRRRPRRRKQLSKRNIARNRSRGLYRKKSARWKPVILAIEGNQSLNEAVQNALAPGKRANRKLLRSLRNIRLVKWVKYRYYSRAKKRYRVAWKKRIMRVRLRKGIYIIRLDRHLRVTKAKRVGSVILSSSKYQNQQYLNNSYFARGVKQRAL